MLEIFDYKDPDMHRKGLDEEIPKEKRADMKLVDFACGTGVVPMRCADLGFKHWVGFDASQKMLDKAIERKLYEDTGCIYHGSNQFPQKYVGYFDIATCAGGFLPAHMPPDSFVEFYDAVKVGGYLAFSMKESHLTEELKYLPLIRKFISEGKIKLLRQIYWVKYKGLDKEKDKIFFMDNCHFMLFKKLK